MHVSHLSRFFHILQKESELLDTGQFGEGLWPIDPVLGQFLYWLIRTKGLRHGLEVGAGVGYSTFWIAKALSEKEGKLTTFEFFPPKVEQLEQHLMKFFGKEYHQFINVVPSSFTKGYAHLGPQKFDFVFFDQRKSDYLKHLQMMLPKLKKGAYICADNVLSHPDASQEYLDFVRRDQRFETIIVSEGAGLSVSRYIG